MIRNSVKLRSLVLTVLLVVSVFAGPAAGSVAAAGNVPGEGPSVTDATHYDDSDGDPVLELAFTENIDTSSVNETTEITVTLENGTSLTVYDDGYENGFSTRTLESGRLVVDTDGTTYNTVEDLTIDGIQDPDGSALERQTVDVQYAATTVDTTDTATDEVDAYRGANVSFVSGTSVGTTLDIEGQDDVSYDVARGSGQNSEVYVWETEGRTLGTYTVSDGSDEVDVNLRSLGLSVSMDEDSYETDESVTGTVETNDVDRDVTVELLDESDDVEATQTITIDSDGSAEFDFGTVDEGNYTVEAQDIDTQVTDSTDEFSVVDNGPATTGFADATYMEARGDVVDITVTVAETDTATVQIGESQNANYNITAEVEDDDGDGTIDLQFNTFRAGTGDSSPDDVIEAGDDDAVNQVSQGGSFTTDHSGTPGSEILDSGEYDLLVSAGEMDGTTVTNSDDVASLSLTERSTENITVLSAPQNDFNRMNELDEIDEFIGEGVLVRSPAIAEGDLYTVAVTANGLEGAFDDSEEYQEVSGDARLFSLTYEFSNGANADPEVINVSDFEDDDIHVVHDDTDDNTLDTTYIVVESDELVERASDHESGDSYEANFTVFGGAADNDLDDQNTSVTDSASVEDMEVSLDTNDEDQIVAAASSNQVISGETNLATDTDFVLRVMSDGSEQGFVYEVPATVQSDGTFQATVNFSEASPGDNFTAQLRLDEQDIGDSYEGYLVEAGEAPPAQGETVSGTPGEGTAEDETTELSPVTEETTTEPESPENTTTAERTTGEEGPGFTAVSAVIALVAAALLAVRREV